MLLQQPGLLSSSSAKQKPVIKFLRALGECKYDFQAWGECDLATGKKNRTGVLRRALMDATCAATVTATKPCGRIPKLQGIGTAAGQQGAHQWATTSRNVF